MIGAEFQPVSSRALAALERGRGAEAAQHLGQALRSPALRREDELALRCALAEAWLLQDDIDQASAALGRQPDLTRELIEPARLSALWRLHGRITSARGDQSRAIALVGRALRQAELAHDSRAIGLAHLELGLCYKQVGDLAIVRDHLTRAASALHAAGDRRNLALVHSLSGITYAQTGRYDESMGAFRQGEHLATQAQADDVLATICGNQANVAMMRHRHEQALALAERAVALHERGGSPHGLAVALATLGQICVRLGTLVRAEQALNRALELRTPVQFQETTGAVFDTLAQIHLIRGSFERASEYLRQAREAYGSYGRQASRWYEWSIRLLTARLALRRGQFSEAFRLAEDMKQEPSVPPADLLQAELVAVEVLLGEQRLDQADERLAQVGAGLDPRLTPGVWGEYLRLRAVTHALRGRPTEAYHDLAQSASVFELLGERYQAALSHLALGRLVWRAGARSTAERHLREATSVFEAIGATPDLEAARAFSGDVPVAVVSEYVGSPVDADDVIVRRLVDAAAVPDLLALEVAATMLEASGGDAAVVFIAPPGDGMRVIASAGCEGETAGAIVRSAVSGAAYGAGEIVTEELGRDREGLRRAAVASPRKIGHVVARRLRMIAAVARQGFELVGSREGAGRVAAAAPERRIETLLPGFVCASPAMALVVEHVQRLQHNELTVLVTGESGTGKELVARAIHLSSPRSGAVFLPYNCTTTTRELADSQLFGHRRGAFTGAITDQPGLIRSADGGTLFLDEVGDLPLEVQPKLLRFLEQGEVIPVGETKPQRVQVRVLAATNTDLEQRVAEGRFREDLFYRLAVIRIHVPPLRERRAEIPHLCAMFLREASERLGKPDVRLSSGTLERLSEYWWPGNVRQLRNEIQRGVALAAPGGVIGPEHLTAEVAARDEAAGPGVLRQRLRPGVTLVEAVDNLERELIREALERAGGNISETARQLGLTRRGLYLKLRRLGFDTAAGLATK